ncbi:UDP-2,3-diacylglucosamine diphosphatase LpxI [Ciceribacter sp. L1K23]|uniref:LpxI family protein n=1 Tax=Ciceribacter sp. L1K23 TaxID=2820276 RepID=UPI001B827BFD|nr:UDP-2,3-diacylglucosamine diphosphatase LpxI [Ciceribacter sp. L1K23]MBR0555705.1 UDP-2,3-diacylglucosamine diphosphatase LpxI [Ciceribacter sp. L1K23]
MATAATASRAGRLAIIAGDGKLPLYVAQAARAGGENPFILPLRNEAAQDWHGFDSAVIGVGDMAGLARLLKQNAIGRVVLSGGVRRRPAFGEIRANLRHILKLPSVVRTLLAGGDDVVLKMVIELIEAQGVRVVGAHEIAPDLLATAGPIGKVVPGEDDRRDIARAAEAAEALGRLDVGQGAVSVGGRIVALEGVEGTDAMLARVADLRAEGRISKSRKGVLVKLCKPQQDVRADLPTIGRSTVENAVKAGLAGIAVEAGRSLIVDREALVAMANDAGLFVCGLDRSLPGDGI